MSRGSCSFCSSYKAKGEGEERLEMISLQEDSPQRANLFP